MLFTFAVSGFVSFGLEIIWFRMLILLFRPTTYAFTVMLATVLAGIAIGSWLSTPVTSRRRANLVGVLAVLELLLALAAVVSMWLMGHAGSVYSGQARYSPARRSPTSDRSRSRASCRSFPRHC